MESNHNCNKSEYGSFSRIQGQSSFAREQVSWLVSPLRAILQRALALLLRGAYLTRPHGPASWHPNPNLSPEARGEALMAAIVAAGQSGGNILQGAGDTSLIRLANWRYGLEDAVQAAEAQVQCGGLWLVSLLTMSKGTHPFPSNIFIYCRLGCQMGTHPSPSSIFNCCRLGCQWERIPLPLMYPTIAKG